MRLGESWYQKRKEEVRMKKRLSEKLVVTLAALLIVLGAFCLIGKAFAADDNVKNETVNNKAVADNSERVESGTKIDDIKLSNSELMDFVKRYDENGDGYISESEAAEVSSIYSSTETSQADLDTLLKLCPNVVDITCDFGSLKEISFPENNSINSLNIKTKAEAQVSVSGLKNKIDNLSYTTYGSKKYTFDFAKCSAYKNADIANISGSQINGVECLDASVSNLYVENTSINNFNMTSNNKIKNVYTVYNKKLKSVTIENCPELSLISCISGAVTKLDINGCGKLDYLYCDENKLTKLDISKFKNLKDIGCGKNKLTKFDISKNKKLETIFCNDNKLKELNISRNKQLTYLDCSGNKLNELNVTSNKKLNKLLCYGNKFTKINLSRNKNLNSITLNTSYKLLSSCIPSASKGRKNKININIKKGTKLNLIQYAPVLKKAKFSVAKKGSKYITVNKKGVINVKRQKSHIKRSVTAILNKTEYRFVVTGF